MIEPSSLRDKSYVGDTNDNRREKGSPSGVAQRLPPSGTTGGAMRGGQVFLRYFWLSIATAATMMIPRAINWSAVCKPMKVMP